MPLSAEQREATAMADAYLNNVALPTYTELQATVADLLPTVELVARELAKSGRLFAADEVARLGQPGPRFDREHWHLTADKHCKKPQAPLLA